MDLNHQPFDFQSNALPIELLKRTLEIFGPERAKNKIKNQYKKIK